MEQTSLYKRVWGNGECVVLIHGGGIEDPGVTWSQQRDLARHYQVIVPDRRGYGRSSHRKHSWTFEDDAADIQTLLQGKQAHLVGFSAGGIVALVMTGLWPASVRSLTLIEPPAFGIAADQSDVSALITVLQPLFRSSLAPEVFLTGFMNVLGWSIPQPMRLSPQQLRGVEAMMKEPEPWNMEFPLERLAALSCPKLVVSGDWHPAFLITADSLASRLQAERLLIKGANHAAHKEGRIFNDRLLALMQSAQQS